MKPYSGTATDSVFAPGGRAAAGPSSTGKCRYLPASLFLSVDRAERRLKVRYLKLFAFTAAAALLCVGSGCIAAGRNDAKGGAAAGLVQPAMTVNVAEGVSFKRFNVVVVLPLSGGAGETPPSQIELQGLTKQLVESFEVYSRFRVLNSEEQERVAKMLPNSGDLEDGGLIAAAKVGRQLDADLVVSGVVSDFGGTKSARRGGEVKDYQNEGNFNLRLWLTDPKSGKTAATISYQKRRDALTDNLFNAKEALSSGFVSKSSSDISKAAFVQIAKQVDSLK